jgi:hypothetical protein
MKLSFKKIAPSMVLAAAFAFLGAVNVNGQTVVGSDDFDGGGVFTTRVLTPDNSANGGAFPTSGFDVFGIVDRSINNAFADDSVSIFVDDLEGIIPETKTDFFVGFADIVNGDNPSGEAIVEWTMDAAGQTGLELSFEIAAMGDFEPADVLQFTASFDGGTPTVIAELQGSDIDVFTYTMDGGALASPFGNGNVEDANGDPVLDADGNTIPETNTPDPFCFIGAGTVSEPEIIIINEFQTLTFPITGSGTTLTLALSFNGNASGETMAIDNVQVTAGGGTGVTGDFDGDGDVDCDDIDMFAGNIGSTSATFDLDGSGTVDLLDVELHVETLVVTSNGSTGTALGDLNCDGQVNVLGDGFPLVANLGNSGTVYTSGDINFSGTTDVLGDAFVLVANLGFSNN